MYRYLLSILIYGSSVNFLYSLILALHPKATHGKNYCLSLIRTVLYTIGQYKASNFVQRYISDKEVKISSHNDLNLVRHIVDASNNQTRFTFKCFKCQSFFIYYSSVYTIGITQVLYSLLFVQKLICMMDHSNTFLSRKLILSFKVLEVKKETMSGLMSILSVVVLVFIGWRGDRQIFQNIGRNFELI